MVVLRRSTPNMVFATWKIIESTRGSRRHGTEADDLLEGLQQDFFTSETGDLRAELSKMAADDLVRMAKKNGKDYYKLPEHSYQQDESHDWYCFKCHNPGDVLLCKSCCRTYHSDCAKRKNAPPPTAAKFQCIYCQNTVHPEADSVSQQELNSLLQFTCDLIREKMKVLQKINKDEIIKEWKREYLCFVKIDTNDIQEKVSTNSYKNLQQFILDVETYYHNTVICYGPDSAQAILAEAMSKECNYEVDEMKQCLDCYKYSNEKSCPEWFCLPCRKPHDLVYAKIKGFPFWPGKVIRLVNGKYDVRFFGGRYERSLIDSDNIKPVSEENKITLNKRSVPLMKARSELLRHMELIEEVKKGVDVVAKLCAEAAEKPEKHSVLKSKKSATPKSEAPKTKGTKRKASLDTEKKPPPSKKRRKSQESDVPSHDEVQNAEGSENRHDYIFEEPKSEEKKKEPKSDTPKSNKKERKSKGKDDKPTKAEKQASTSEESKATPRLVKTFNAQIAQLQHNNDMLQKDNDMLQKEVQELKAEIEQTKVRHWCYNCKSLAKYYCCWNGSYCSKLCQDQSWKKHRKYCKRVRQAMKEQSDQNNLTEN